MFMIMMTLAGAVAQTAVPVAPATTAAPAARTLRTLPDSTIDYYDVPGKNGDAISKSLRKMLTDPATIKSTQLYTYDIGTQVTKSTTGTKCTITGAHATLKSSIHLPRLAEEAKVPASDLARWRAYAAGIENDAAANLWFLTDHLRGLEQSIVGQDCDKASPVFNAGLTKLTADATAFSTQRALAAKNKAAKR